jgi:hypothetical protein
VLNQEDEKRLAAIEADIRREDLLFAESLRLGRPRCPRGDQRWPFQFMLAVGLLLFTLGLNSAVLSLLTIGAGIAVIGWRGDRYRRVSRHRPPRRAFG